MKRLCCLLTGLLFAITPVHAFDNGAPRTAYSTAYPYVRLFLSHTNTIPFGTAWAFTSADAVSDLFGNTSQEYALAQDAFSGPHSGAATVLFARFVLGQGRARIYGGNLNGNITLRQVHALDGDTLSVIENGQTVSITYPSSGSNAPSGISDACPPGGSPTANCLYDLARITTTLFNTAQPTNATLSSSTIVPGAGASFTGSVSSSILSVTAVKSGTIQIGGQITTSGGYKGHIAGQMTGPGGCEPVGSRGCTAGGIGAYNSLPLVSASVVPDGTSITESWGVITVGSVGLSDTMNSGDQITGSGINTYLAANLNRPGLGSCTGPACNGSTWTVSDQSVCVRNACRALSPNHLQL